MKSGLSVYRLIGKKALKKKIQTFWKRNKYIKQNQPILQMEEAQINFPNYFNLRLTHFI